jgi:hypothetical protein
MIAGGQDKLTETGGPHHCTDEVGKPLGRFPHGFAWRISPSLNYPTSLNSRIAPAIYAGARARRRVLPIWQATWRNEPRRSRIGETFRLDRSTPDAAFAGLHECGFEAPRKYGFLAPLCRDAAELVRQRGELWTRFLRQPAEAPLGTNLQHESGRHRRLPSTLRRDAGLASALQAHGCVQFRNVDDRVSHADGCEPCARGVCRYDERGKF